MKRDRVHNLFSSVAAGMEDALAVEYGDRRMRYRELEEESNNLANFLLATGAAKGSLVAILAEDRIEVVMAIIAVLKAGCVFIPLDPNLPERRLASMVAEVPPSWFIVESTLIDRIPVTSGANVICLDSGDVPYGERSDLVYLREYAGYRNIEKPNTSSQPDDMCYIYFTSGSTGQPKGIAGRLKAIDHFVKWELETFGIGEGTRVSQLTSPSFDAYLRDIFVPLCSGGTVCVPREARTSLDVKSLIEWIDLQKINLIHCVPSLFRSMLGFGLRPNYFSALKHVLLAGEPVLPSDVRRWTDIFGERIQLVNMYGPSETTMTKLFYLIKPPDSGRRSIPIGKPMPGARAMVVGSDGKTCPPGTVGEIYIRTPFRSLGYYNRPELTSKAFIPNPFTGEPDDLIYKTGDLGRVLEDGNLEFLGRKDQQVKIRGIRVELKEIEDLLLGHECVKDIAVIDRDDALGNKYLCAYVECAGETDVSFLKDYLALRLPAYLVPSMFVKMVSLPRTITGKIDRRALPSIDQERAAAGRVYLAPRTPIEEVLAAIWSQVLNLEKIGIEEDFFTIGGHSLMATQVISRVKAAFEVELPLQALFESPTVKGLAEQVESALREGRKLKAPPIIRTDRNGPIPLSYAQQRLWFIDQFEPGTALYNIPGALRLKGELRPEILERAINEVIKRHEVLRTRFEADDGEPVQIIDEWRPRRLEKTDLTGLTREEKEAAARRIAGLEGGTGFDLSHGPLLRVKVLKLEEEEHILLYTVHHIVSDGWSMGILIREVEALYQAYNAGEESPLEELPIQYADFAVWQREWLKGEVLERQMEYWRGQLKDLPILELPIDHPRPAVQSFRGTRYHFRIDGGLSHQLQALSRAEGATLFMTLLTAFQSLLGRYSGQQDVAVGTVIANRNHLETEGLIGFFVNQLVLRIDLSAAQSFRGLLGRARQIVLESYAHQDLPFEQLVEELAPRRDLSRSPLCQAVFVLQNTPREGTELTGLSLSGFEVESKVAKWDLTLNMNQNPECLSGSWEYCLDLFEEETIRRMTNHFQMLLRSAVSNSECRLSELEILTDAEREQILVKWNRSETDHSPQHCAHELFETQAMLRPEAVSVVYEGQELSYGELNHRANKLANYLRRLGVSSEMVVGMYLERSLEMVIGMLGVLKAGSAYLPLNPAFPPERLAYMLADSQVPILLSQANLVRHLQDMEARVICLDSDWERIAQEQREKPAVATIGENLAYVIYTSGSTGQPKGVMIGHQGLGNLVEQQISSFGVKPHDRVLQFASLSFDASVFEIFMALGSGAILCLAGEERLRPGTELCESLKDNAITVATLPPVVLSVLDEKQVCGVGKIISAGEECASQIIEQWAGDRRFFNAYGPTEVTVWATLAECEAGHKRKPPIGRPIGNVQSYVLDEAQRLVPVGIMGELCIGGTGLGRGYLRRPDLTAEKFIPHPFGSEGGARLYRTGDLARYLPDGDLEFFGRTDHQVKLRGHRIELGEIDAALCEHPKVKHCAVLLRENGLEQKQLVAYVVAKERFEVEAGEAENWGKELREYLQRRLPEYMVPSVFAALKELPLTSNGKVDRQRLPALTDARQSMGAEFVAPRDILELQMVRIWESVLGVPGIGVKDNFFDLGGHSLLAARLMARIRQVMGRELPLSALFQWATVESLAGILRRDPSAVSGSCLVELQASGSQPPLFFVHPAGGNVLCYLDLAQCLGPDRPFYGFQAPGLYGERQLYTRIEDLAAHHIEALKTVQPQGPYFLGGWSLGGVIAYEMAQQLCAQDQVVDQLLLLDCSAPRHGEDGIEGDGGHTEAESIEVDEALDLIGIFGDALPISVEELELFEGDERIRYVIQNAIAMNLLPPDISAAQARTILRVFRANESALHKYIPRLYPGTVTLFMTSTPTTMPTPDGSETNEQIASPIEDSTKGWGDLVTGKMRVVEVPGDHHSMVSKPHVETLALRIRECLEHVE